MQIVINGNNIITLPTIDSTNEYAKRAISKGLAASGNIYFALEQTSGKGRQNKKWHSEKGKNLMITIPLQLNILDTKKINLFNQSITLSVFDTINRFITNDIAIKWSNDILWQNKKIAGILIENIAVNKTRWMIVGIGINVNQTIFPSEVPNVSSIQLITGEENNIEEIIVLLTEKINYWLDKFINNNEKIIIDSYHQHLYLYKKPITLKYKNKIIKTNNCGVNTMGQLMTDYEGETVFNAGEVETIIE